MERKNKYVSPKTMVLHLQTAFLLAGSGSGGASAGPGGDPNKDPDHEITVVPGPGGNPQPGGGAIVESKGSSFNAWETWEEY